MGPMANRHDTLAARGRARKGDRICRAQEAFDLRVQGYGRGTNGGDQRTGFGGSSRWSGDGVAEHPPRESGV